MVNFGDAETVAHRAVGGRTAPLAKDSFVARISDYVMDGQKVLGVFTPSDQCEFFEERFFDFIRGTVWISVLRTRPRQILQMLLRRLARRHWLVGIFIFEFAKRKAASLGNLQGPCDCFGKFFEQP